jgi:hypothetical protein
MKCRGNLNHKKNHTMINQLSEYDFLTHQVLLCILEGIMSLQIMHTSNYIIVDIMAIKNASVCCTCKTSGPKLVFDQMAAEVPEIMDTSVHTLECDVSVHETDDVEGTFVVEGIHSLKTY